MEKMISYIFGSMELHERAIGSIIRSLNKQTSFNKSVTLFAIATTSYMIVADARRKEDAKKIAKLTKEVEEMKKVKGE